MFFFYFLGSFAASLKVTGGVSNKVSTFHFKENNMLIPSSVVKVSILILFLILWESKIFRRQVWR